MTMEHRRIKISSEKVNDSLKRFMIEFKEAVEDSKLVKTITNDVDANRYRYKETLEIIPSNLDEQRLLDIGTKYGHLAYLVKNLRRYEIVSMDRKRSDIKGCLSFFRDVGLKFIFSDACNLPFRDESFEVVLFCEVIEHIMRYPNVALDEIYRVLRPGGSLVLSAFNYARLQNRIRLLVGKNPSPLYFPKEGFNGHYRQYVRFEIEEMLRETGFEVKETKMTNSPIMDRTKKWISWLKIMRFFGLLFPNVKYYMIILGEKPLRAKA